MTCLQRLRHSLACTARRKRLGETRQRVVQKGKGKRIPWRAERVQHIPDLGPCFRTRSPSWPPSSLLSSSEPSNHRSESPPLWLPPSTPDFPDDTPDEPLSPPNPGVKRDKPETGHWSDLEDHHHHKWFALPPQPAWMVPRNIPANWAPPQQRQDKSIPEFRSIPHQYHPTQDDWSSFRPPILER